MEGCIVQFQRLCQSRSRKLVSVIALMFSVLLVLQTFTLPFKRTYSTQHPSSKSPAIIEWNSLNWNFSSQSQRVGKLSLLSDSHGLMNSLNFSGKPDRDLKVNEMEGELQNDDSNYDNWLDDDENLDIEFSNDLGDETILKTVENSNNGFLFIADGNSKENPHLAVEKTGNQGNELMEMQEALSATSSKKAIISMSIISSTEDTEADIATSLSQKGKQELSDNETFVPTERSQTKLNASGSSATIPSEKNRLVIPPLTMSEMYHLLLMKIFGPSTLCLARDEMNYIQYMKSSKYCICPRGYEVNSPRLVESIFFECVPVIIADNYVPPFFEILNWEKFSVIVPEKGVHRLKEILVSITESEYRELQMGVKKVQRHFLWRTKPAKYDLFHMILHSIWLSRVYKIEVR